MSKTGGCSADIFPAEAAKNQKANRQARGRGGGGEKLGSQGRGGHPILLYYETEYIELLLLL